jgi:hypothetical protein
LPGFSLNRTYMETMMGVSEPMPAEVTENIGPPPAKGLAKLREYLKLRRSQEVFCGRRSACRAPARGSTTG